MNLSATSAYGGISSLDRFDWTIVIGFSTHGEGRTL